MQLPNMLGPYSLHLASGSMLACVLLAACSGDASAVLTARVKAERTSAVREVRTVRAEVQAWPSLLNVRGECLALDETTIATKVAGRIETLAFDLGSKVERGALLATIERRDHELRVAAARSAVHVSRTRLGLPFEGDEDLVASEGTATVREARAELDDARHNRDRLAGLLRERVSSEAALQNAEALLNVAESRLQAAFEEIENRRAQLALRRVELSIAIQALEDTRIVAPYDGVIRARLVSLGELASAGSPVAEIVRLDPVRLRVEIPERDAPLVHVGLAVRVTTSGRSAQHLATLTRMSPALDARTRTLSVEADLANADGSLRPGQFAEAEIVLDASAQALTVPASALVSFAGIHKVLVVDGEKAQEVRVVTGRRDPQRVEIQSGLKAGLEVVLEPGNLQTGDAVRRVQ